MAFGQQTGPPAGQRQLETLGELLAALGFDNFREARHRLGLTQRQANGRFTVSEADELIERLEAGVQVEESTQFAAEASSAPDGSESAPPVVVTKAFQDKVGERRRQEHARNMVDVPDEVMADELVSRGWCCIPPPGDG